MATTRLVLYYDDVSPCVRSCLMLIKMLDLDVECKFVDLFKGEQMKPDFLELNPIHTVPTLIDGDLVLTDSHVILMHLCDSVGKDLAKATELFPKDYTQRVKIINMLFFECSCLFRRDSEFLSEIVRKGFVNIDTALHDRKLIEAYGIMEKFLQRHRYMAGDGMTLADLSILTTLSTVNLMFPVAAGAEDKWPRLHDWFQRMQAVPHYDINQRGLAKLKAVIERLGKFKFPTPPGSS